MEADASGRSYAYSIPCLTECRAAFEAQLGTTLPWEPEADDYEPAIVDEDEEDPLA